MAEHEELAAFERQFRRSGLPLFIEDYSASEDVFNRASVLLAMVFVAEVVGATDLEAAFLLNLAAGAAGLAILVTAFGILNRWRGRQFWSIPRQLGVVELTAFVVLPALLPVIFGPQWRQFFGVLGGNLALLIVIYLVVGYGLLPTLGWALTRVADELRASLTRLMRALPMLMIFSIVLFINTEMWQVFDPMPTQFVVLVVGLFLGFGAVFLALRMPAEVAHLEAEVGGGGPPLRRRQRLNVGVTLVVSQMVQVFVVSAGVGLFFVLLGSLTISSDVLRGWGIDDVSSWSVPLLGHHMYFTDTLIRVAIGIASITGLYYAISIMTDATYRKEFMGGVIDELKGTFAAREKYLECRERLGVTAQK